MNASVNVLYIGGSGRSGSTILARTLGRAPGFFDAGELWQLWDRGLLHNELCGCGEPFGSCPFWTAVGREAFGGWRNVDAERMASFKPLLRRLRYLPHYLALAGAGVRTRKVEEMLGELGPALERLYRALREVSGACVVVDSSKRFSYAAVLGSLPSVEVRAVHLVRDSRAVAHSWSRSKVRPEAGGSSMPRLGPLKASRTWSLQNLQQVLLPLSGGVRACARLRYEDFVREPASSLRKTLRELGLEADLRFIRGREVPLSRGHTVSGNPARFESGGVELSPDEAWRERMRAGDRALVTALTAPLLAGYGYPLVGRGYEGCRS
ncbi:sulfotransferase [Rubrobacter xylanophilus]|uniref:Sulfotransferase n=1 Tax=Rubrobacter xylanophilus TaxID=49319 RepID=A0A510HLP1_9ACTN|nr:sulfotransferase [Rubrobacter xylanophilus]BBL79337.1 sulfotransferase [Rubrobacter xylanophilus]